MHPSIIHAYITPQAGFEPTPLGEANATQLETNNNTFQSKTNLTDNKIRYKKINNFPTYAPLTRTKLRYK